MSENVTHVTTDTFQQEVLESDVPVVADFWAPWCGPCRAIGPLLEQLGEQYEGRVKVVKVNVDQEGELAQAFEVRGIPNLLVFAGGEVVDQVVGFGGKAPLVALFEEHAADEAIAS